MDLLRQAETIKQLQKQVTVLEGQSREAGKVFLATVTTLISSAFALVAALAWNDAIQALFKQVFVPGSDEAKTTSWTLVATSFGYALLVTVIVVIVIYYLTRLSKRFGGTSLIGEAAKGEGAKKE
jgi:ABC-type multidrug transport system fused ATPase/permease subunit